HIPTGGRPLAPKGCRRRTERRGPRRGYLQPSRKRAPSSECPKRTISCRQCRATPRGRWDRTSVATRRSARRKHKETGGDRRRGSGVAFLPFQIGIDLGAVAAGRHGAPAAAAVARGVDEEKIAILARAGAGFLHMVGCQKRRDIM